MSWEIEEVEAYQQWLRDCDQDTQESVIAMYPLLREHGPHLSRPFADTLKDSKYPNMKELRATATVRVCFAFDPERNAILLIGGDKAGKPERRFYKALIKKADRLFSEHLATLNKGKK